VSVKRVKLTRLRGEHGSGSVLALAIAGAVVGMATLMVPVLSVLVAGQSVRNAADAAALAAADTASGAVAGIPCDAASEAASLNDATLEFCALDGLIASVTVSRSIGAFDLSSTARAGPPGS
jgi:secretion/DNA translocation related TadE-like protein